MCRVRGIYGIIIVVAQLLSTIQYRKEEVEEEAETETESVPGDNGK